MNNVIVPENLTCWSMNDFLSFYYDRIMDYLCWHGGPDVSVKASLKFYLSMLPRPRHKT